MNRAETIKWGKSALIAALGGGIASTVAAAMDPTKWRFPQDVFSGKLTPFFLAGAAIAFGGMLLRSPLGQSAMQSYKDAQADLTAAQQDIAKAKAELKPPTGPAGK